VLGFVRKIGFEYSVVEIFEYSLNMQYEYCVATELCCMSLRIACFCRFVFE